MENARLLRCMSSCHMLPPFSMNLWAEKCREVEFSRIFCGDVLRIFVHSVSLRKPADRLGKVVFANEVSIGGVGGGA